MVAEALRVRRRCRRHWLGCRLRCRSRGRRGLGRLPILLRRRICDGLRGRLLVRHRPIQFGEAGRDPGQMMGDRCDILGEPGNHRPLRFGHAGHHRAEPLEFG